MMKLGLLTYPIMVIAIIMKDPGPVARFMKAGAVSPETARNPVSVKVTRRSHLDGLLRRGLLVDAGEGRMYVNVEAYRRSRRNMILAAVVGGGVLTAVAWWMMSTLQA